MRLRLVFGLAAYVILLSGLVGCRQQPASTYNSREELTQLSPEQQQPVNDLLVKLFGTPSDPHIRLPEYNDEGELTYVETISPEILQHGREVFTKNCAGCHGATGDGAGPAAEYLSPRPRDYRLGIFKFTSTNYGLKPHRLDLERVIREGARGTSMPAFPWLADADLQAVVEYVIMLSRRGEVELRATDEMTYYEAEDFQDAELVAELENDILPGIAVDIHDSWQVTDAQIVHPSIPAPPVTEENILAGQKLFLDAQNGCFKCHGEDGMGGLLDPENAIDNWGDPLIAADLTTGFFHGGRRPVDIYRRIDTGINGRMPSFHSVYGDDPEKIWQLVQFVTAVSEGRDIPPPEPPQEELEEEDIEPAETLEATEEVEETPGDAESAEEDAAEDESTETDAAAADGEPEEASETAEETTAGESEATAEDTGEN